MPERLAAGVSDAALRRARDFVKDELHDARVDDEDAGIRADLELVEGLGLVLLLLTEISRQRAERNPAVFAPDTQPFETFAEAIFGVSRGQWFPTSLEARAIAAAAPSVEPSARQLARAQLARDAAEAAADTRARRGSPFVGDQGEP